MKKICTADIESNNWIEFLMLGFFDGENYYLFNSVDKFLTHINNKIYNGYRIYFHNGGKFDFLFLIEKLMNLGNVQFVNRGTSILSLRFRTDKVSLEFTDSYALLPASLEKLIETFNIQEKKIEIDFNKRHKFEERKLQKHLENDCISLYKILRQVEEREGFLSLTIASNALRNFEYKFFTGYIWNVSNNFDNYFRKNYYSGGRVEVYKGFGKNLYYYDFNSLFPSVMLNKMPFDGIERVNRYKENKIGYYKIELKQETNFLISPLLTKTKTGNYYVNADKGNIFYLMSPEIDFLHKANIKFKVLDGYIFNKQDYLFNDYIDFYYEQKRTSKNEVSRYFAKLMLNSLYGKFGQQLTGERIVTGYESGAKIFDASNDLFLVDTKRKIKFKGVYLASYITSLARAKHLDLIYSLGEENIWYGDTDSIITNKKINTSDKIGNVKLEAKIKEACFLMPKTYGYIDNEGNEIVKYKGFNSKEFSYFDLKNLLTGKVEKLEQITKRFLGYRESISFNKAKNSKREILKIAGENLILTKQVKELTFNYSRREIIPDKKTVFKTKPFKFAQIG